MTARYKMSLIGALECLLSSDIAVVHLERDRLVRLLDEIAAKIDEAFEAGRQRGAYEHATGAAVFDLDRQNPPASAEEWRKGK